MVGFLTDTINAFYKSYKEQSIMPQFWYSIGLIMSSVSRLYKTTKHHMNTTKIIILYFRLKPTQVRTLASRLWPSQHQLSQHPLRHDSRAPDPLSDSLFSPMNIFMPNSSSSNINLDRYNINLADIAVLFSGIRAVDEGCREGFTPLNSSLV